MNKEEFIKHGLVEGTMVRADGWGDHYWEILYLGDSKYFYRSSSGMEGSATYSTYNLIPYETTSSVSVELVKKDCSFIDAFNSLLVGQSWIRFDAWNPGVYLILDDDNEIMMFDAENEEFYDDNLISLTDINEKHWQIYKRYYVREENEK